MPFSRLLLRLERGRARLAQRLFARLQRLAQSHPRLHLTLTLGLALTGYAFLLGPPLLSAAFAAAALAALAEGPAAALSPAAAAAGLALFSLALLRLEFPRPQGIRLSRRTAPRLFGLIEEVRRQLHAAPVHRVHVDESLGVELLRIPRHGLPLTHDNVLLIGYPLLACFSAEQLRALLAGRIGEISVHNLGVVAWLCQLRQTWLQYRVAAARLGGPSGFLLRLFFDHFTPLYARLSAPLVRDRELRRDHYALQLVEEEVLAATLSLEVAAARFLEDYYWPRIYRSAERLARPGFRVYSNLGVVFAGKLKDRNPQAWVREAFARASSATAGPSLRERLAALGLAEPWPPRAPGRSAAEALLEDAGRPLAVRLERRWLAREQEGWALRHQRSCSERQRLRRLRSQAEAGTLRGSPAMEYLALVRRHGSEAQARAAAERILELNPEDPGVLFGVGKYFIGRQEPQGVKLLEQAMALDKRCVSAACRLISGFVIRTRNQPALRQYVAQVIHGPDRRLTG
ncbi:hypothetical protein QVG61_13150 [Thiohalobacter sp. IOR34]|uniref:hypothetical protein n=1 Tax=Thiohalobacter sp. IOR34 TaxID=3057176 RepID=UPI0025B06010|nr:hypothetical protein [Thiohalobacter sp. IOR34]WJW75417.1 hypothetical protein QVG61_13150 [Thiohalobacter sp. IOR34]